MILLDRPFQLGDRVRFGGEYGDSDFDGTLAIGSTEIDLPSVDTEQATLYGYGYWSPEPWIDVTAGVGFTVDYEEKFSSGRRYDLSRVLPKLTERTMSRLVPRTRIEPVSVANGRSTSFGCRMRPTS